jgi:hypothetical protein
MQPRLSSSRKWTALPKELMQQIRSVFKETFKQQIGKGKIEAEGRIYPEEILVSVGYRPETGIKQCNFQVSIAYKKDKDDVLKLINIAVDAAGSLFDQLFSAENDQEFPRLWQEVDFEGRMIFVQYSTENSELEAEADQILGSDAAKAGIAGGDWDEGDDVDPDEIKAKLGIADDDDDGEGSTNH